MNSANTLHHDEYLLRCFQEDRDGRPHFMRRATEITNYTDLLICEFPSKDWPDYNMICPRLGCLISSSMMSDGYEAILQKKSECSFIEFLDGGIEFHEDADYAFETENVISEIYQLFNMPFEYGNIPPVYETCMDRLYNSSCDYETVWHRQLEEDTLTTMSAVALTAFIATYAAVLSIPLIRRAASFGARVVRNVASSLFSRFSSDQNQSQAQTQTHPEEHELVYVDVQNPSRTSSIANISTASGDAQVHEVLSQHSQTPLLISSIPNISTAAGHIPDHELLAQCSQIPLYTRSTSNTSIASRIRQSHESLTRRSPAPFFSSDASLTSSASGNSQNQYEEIDLSSLDIPGIEDNTL